MTGEPIKRLRRAAIRGATIAGEILREETARLTARLAASEALLEGMTTEAKRRAAHAVRLEDALLRAHAHHMFGDRPGCDDRMAALGYIRNRGLPEATPADLDAACEGLDTPWGSGPGQTAPREPCEHDEEGSPAADVCWICDAS